MSEEEKQEAVEETPEKTKKPKDGIKLLGGIVALIGVGGALAVMAIPSKEGPKHFEGPFHLPLFESEFVSNVADNHFTRFLKTSPEVEYFAYGADYALNRSLDPLFKSWLANDLGTLLRSQHLDEVYGGVEGSEFTERVRRTAEPILFPVHIGETVNPLDRDVESGLRPGDSYRHSTFRGQYHDHTLKVDGTGRTLQLDEGELVPFNGTELDLFVADQTGEGIFVDVTQVEDEFVGEIHVGVHGRVRQVFMTQNIAQ